MVASSVAVVIVLAFAVVNGVNDGGTLVATGLRTVRSRAWLRPVVLVAIAGLAPLILGSQVAVTLASRLVAFGADGTRFLLGAVIATMAVVWTLTRLGHPTSLTLGLIGAIGGTGAVSGQPVSWTTIGFVLAIGALAPALGLVLAVLLARGVVPLLSPRGRRALERGGFLLQALAYGANDGQKMLAVAAVVAGTTATLPGVPVLLWIGVVVAFAAGTLVGVVRIGPTMDTRILPSRTDQIAVAQLAGATSVLGSAAVASPVSLVQSMTGGLVGAGLSVTHRRVRWAVVTQIAITWVVTLPATFVVGALFAAGLRWGTP